MRIEYTYYAVPVLTFTPYSHLENKSNLFDALRCRFESPINDVSYLTVKKNGKLGRNSLKRSLPQPNHFMNAYHAISDSTLAEIFPSSLSAPILSMTCFAGHLGDCDSLYRFSRPASENTAKINQCEDCHFQLTRGQYRNRFGMHEYDIKPSSHGSLALFRREIEFNLLLHCCFIMKLLKGCKSEAPDIFLAKLILCIHQFCNKPHNRSIHLMRTIRGGGSESDSRLYMEPRNRDSSYQKNIQNIWKLIDNASNLPKIEPRNVKNDRSIIVREELAPLRMRCSSILKSVLSWRPKYIIVKALFLLYYASLGAVMPYLPVYFQSLGVSDRRIGHLGAITPAVTFLASPFWGYLTDSTGKLKEVLLFTFITSVIFRVMMIMRNSFMWLVTMITITSLVNAPVRTLLDSSVLNLLDDKKEYGRQRLWGQWGFGLGSFAVGQILAKFGLTYKAAFGLHAAISIPTLFILLRFRPKKQKTESPKFKEGLRVISGNPDVIAFFSLVGAIGISSGVIENFAYKRLRELGADHHVLGRSRLVSSAAGVPMFWISGNMTRYISVEGILLLSLLSFIVRFCIYASVRNPWHALPAEALRGACFACFWAASTAHSHKIAPPGLSTTMLGFLQAIYGGIGQSIGSLLGGGLSSVIGTAKTFYVYAAIDTIILSFFCIYFAATHIVGNEALKNK